MKMERRMSNPPSKDEMRETVDRVCRGVGSVQEGQRVREHIADLQQFHDWAEPQITDLNRGFPAETSSPPSLKERVTDKELQHQIDWADKESVTYRALLELQLLKSKGIVRRVVTVCRNCAGGD